MARRKQSSFTPPPIHPIVKIPLVLIWALIALGSMIRKAVRFLIRILLLPVFSLITVIGESSDAASSWFKEKRTLTVKKSKISRPQRKKKISSLSWTKLISDTFFKTIATWQEKAKWVRLPPLFHFTFPKVTIKRKTSRAPIPSTGDIPLVSTPFQIKFIRLQSFTIGVILTVLFVFVPYNAWLFLKSLPNPQLLTQRDLDVSTKILDRNGQLLYEIYLDQNRTPVKLEDIPLIVKQATIAIEDQEFYYHPGFSVKGILRAGTEIAIHKQIQGGSTITQQLIKSALLTPEVSVIRKTKEIILAFWAERLFSKDQIFEMYLNQVPYGGTAWGIEAAAQTYFHKSVHDLNLAEASLLAGLPAAPSEYSPFGNHPEKAIVRQNEVLDRMVVNGYITPDQKKQALAIPLIFAKPRIGIRAPHFVMYVKEILEKTYGQRMLERGGLRIVTSLDLGMQEKVEDIVKSHIDKLTSLQVGNGAAVVTNPRSGDILAMVGSRDYFDVVHDGNVNVTTSLRQPGSSIKVVTYTAALENGMTAATILHDAPVVYQSAGSPPYAPVNYDNTFHGPVPLRYALANSYNIPAVKTLATVGLPVMMEKAKQMGVNSWSNDPGRYGLALTLGGGDVTMLEMAKVYGTLANMGKRQDLRPILQVTDYTGKVLEDHRPSKSVDAVKADVAWIISHILADNNARASAFGPNSALVIPDHTVAVKTGTTNEKRDNWTIGYTPTYVAVVWVGNNDNSPMNQFLTSGVTGAAPIWHDIMTEILKGKPDEIVPKPESVVSLPCYFGKVEYFVSGTEPSGGRCAPIPTITTAPTP